MNIRERLREASSRQFRQRSHHALDPYRAVAYAKAQRHELRAAFFSIGSPFLPRNHLVEEVIDAALARDDFQPTTSSLSSAPRGSA